MPPPLNQPHTRWLTVYIATVGVLIMFDHEFRMLIDAYNSAAAASSRLRVIPDLLSALFMLLP